MINTRSLVGSALLAAASLASTGAQAGPAAAPSFEFEKCYGLVAAGKNDCQTANSSCAGTSVRDNQLDAWIYLPAGSCTKLVGGSTTPKG